MIEEDRPDPDALLKSIQEAENTRKKGRLKIFLGMAAGVGKTYAMLESAQKLVREGVDLQVGVINTHGRPETAKLLEGLKCLPEKSLSYKEKIFTELDLEEILKSKPQVIIIDELAHSNIPGSKHPKRWQDILEILDAGIEVYTTLNIQHLESYKDIVEEIVGIRIRETVPDLILETAADIELVDITPSELLQRLKEGKVYTGDLSTIAAQNFFQEDRLTALRELALRFTAEKVDQELHTMISAIQRGRGWQPRERLLVAINDNPYSQQLIRMARRLSFTLHAPWIAVYVDQGETLDDEESARLAKNLSLARELGAEVLTTKDMDIAHGIQRIAEQKGVTQIIIGKTVKKRFSHLFKPSLLDRLTKDSSDIAIHVIRQPPVFLPKKKRALPSIAFSHYLHILFWVGLLSIFNTMIVPYVGYKVVGFIFLLGILFLGLFFKRGPVFFAAILSAFIWEYFFIPPLGKLFIFSADFIFIILFFLVAIVTGFVVNREKKRHELLIKREQSTQAIYEIVREIATAPSSTILFAAVKEKLGSILKGTCDILLRKNNSLLFEEDFFNFDEKEKAVANWVFEHGKEAGWSTSTLPSAKHLYVPLKGFKETLGVLAYRPLIEKPLLPEELNFLYTVGRQLAHYLERVFSEEQERKNKFHQQIEKIYEKVLLSISQELFRPLKTIQKALDDCKNVQKEIKNATLSSSFQKVERASESLLRITENASAMAKLSAGLVAFHKSTHAIHELIESCLHKTRPHLKQHQLKVNIPKNFPFFIFDFSLIEILLNNLLINAIDYSPPGTLIEIEAEVFGDTLVVSIADEGPGIPEDMMDLVFEKFYRIPGTSSPGIGLGLAIAKSIAEIHHGRIKAQNRPTGGAKFSLILPVNKDLN